MKNISKRRQGTQKCLLYVFTLKLAFDFTFQLQKGKQINISLRICTDHVSLSVILCKAMYITASFSQFSILLQILAQNFKFCRFLSISSFLNRIVVVVSDWIICATFRLKRESKAELEIVNSRRRRRWLLFILLQLSSTQHCISCVLVHCYSNCICKLTLLLFSERQWLLVYVPLQHSSVFSCATLFQHSFRSYIYLFAFFTFFISFPF